MNCKTCTKLKRNKSKQGKDYYTCKIDNTFIKESIFDNNNCVNYKEKKIK